MSIRSMPDRLRWQQLDALPDRVRMLLRTDPAALGNDLAAIEQMVWTPHFVPAHYQGDWSVLPLRAPLGAMHPILQIASNPGTREWVDLPVLLAMPAMVSLLGQFECPLASVRLMRLAAGSEILQHREDDLEASWGMARLHIPLATNSEVDFRLNGTRVVMAVGECWYLRLSDLHSVRNEGHSDRVHLVIDAEVNDWLAKQLLVAAGLA